MRGTSRHTLNSFPRAARLWLACWALLCGFAATARADGGHHTLWQVRGPHNTVYLLGSIHVLRESDYPLPAEVERAYAQAQKLVMEVDLDDLDMSDLQMQMLSAAQLPDGETLHSALGAARYAKAQQLATALGYDLGMFDGFAPWFVAESISQLQLVQLGFAPEAGIEMHFMGLAKNDHKTIEGLETARDQIELFRAIPMERQANYLLASLEEASELPREINAMIGAWRHGDTAWFDEHLNGELGRDPALYESVLAARNRKWLPSLMQLLGENKDCLVIVGAGHLVGRGSVIELLRQRGFNPVQE